MLRCDLTDYKHDTHYNKSMGIGALKRILNKALKPTLTLHPIAGVWVNAFLTAAGGATLYYIW